MTAFEKIKMAGLLFALSALPATGLLAEDYVNHFDSPEEIAKFNPGLKDPSAFFDSSRKVEGAGSYKAVDSFLRGGWGYGFKTPLKTGVVTFWAFDSYYEVMDEWRWHIVSFSVFRDDNGKREQVNCELRRLFHGWRLYIKDSTQDVQWFPMTATDGPHHGGWTRFDLVCPAGEGPRQFTLYIDGIKLMTTPGKYDGVVACATNCMSNVDEFSWNSDPAAFRPNPVAAIMPENLYGQIFLEKGEKLEVPLSFDPKGARAKEGFLKVSLLDGRGETLVSKDEKIEWSDVPESVALPCPPRSGYFWLKAECQEPGKPADVVYRRVDLQFTSENFASLKQAPLYLFRKQWDFLPIGKNEPDPAKMGSLDATPEELAEPVAPPSDWSNAFKLRGRWTSLHSFFDFGFSTHAGWYRQQVDVPKAWKGQGVELELEFPEDAATVFVDGKKAGVVEWPGGTLNLSDFVKPGKSVEIAIHVVAPKKKSRGLTGDVILRPVAKGPRIDGVAVRPSVSKKEISAVFELSGLVPGKTYKLKAAVDNAGETVKKLPEKLFVAAAAKEKQTLSAPWADPKLWDFDTPYLYDMDAVLLDDSNDELAFLWPERFGFRELSWNGPDLLLNGRPVTLFNINGAAANTPEIVKWCDKYHYRSFYDGEGRENARLLDELGKTRQGEHFLGLVSPLSDLIKKGSPDDPATLAKIDGMLEYVCKGRLNHPGVFFQYGVLEGQGARNGALYNPLFQNGAWVNRPTESEQALLKTFKMAKHVQDKLHELDPSRPVSAQDSGSANDTMHITEYAGFLQLQEMLEKNEYWRANGTKPFLISEQSAPMFPNWTDCCSQGKGWNGVPCYAEWSAITHGDEAFVRTAKDETFLDGLEKTVEQKRKAAAAAAKSDVERAEKVAKVRMEINNSRREEEGFLPNQIWRDRIREEVFNWRADNLAMLGYFFAGGGPRLDCCYMEFNRPRTGFLAGSKELPKRRAHIFAPGETLERGAVLLNDTASQGELTCKWKLELDGKTVGEGSAAEKIPAGGQAFVPINVKIPAGGDRSGKLTVDFYEGAEKLRSDSCDIDVLAPRPFESKGAIALVDPEGDTAKAFKAAGVKFKLKSFDEDFSSFDTVVFGRRAFNYEVGLLPQGLDLGALTKQGKKILIMEQDEKTLRERFKLRTEYASPRDVYYRGSAKALADGLPESALKYWRGQATLTDGYEPARKKEKPCSTGVDAFGDGGHWLYVWNDDKPHTRPMKWGNTHNVATILAIKPDVGSFRTLIDCEYDLDYAAAWELDAGKSKIVFSQLDVSGRTEPEPAATRYLQNLVKYVQGVKAPVWRQAVYLGGAKDEALLTFLNVPFRKIETPADAAPANDLLVVGDATPAQLASWKDGLADFAKKGGTVFSLPRSEADFAAGWTPFAVAAKAKKVDGTLVGKTEAPLLAGLGDSDFYWKGHVPLVAIEKADGASLLLDSGILAEVPFGKGRYVLCQIEPALFGDIVFDHWLKASERKTERVVRTLLSNSGVAMNEPKLLNKPKASDALEKTIQLAGEWKICPAKPEESSVPANDARDWRSVKLPGSPVGACPGLDKIKGCFWVKGGFELDKELGSSDSCLVDVGRISGADALYVNGEKAAFTNSATDVNAVTVVNRSYKLPAKLFKKGFNELAFLVDYDFNGGLGMREGTGEFFAPFKVDVYKPVSAEKFPEPIDLSSAKVGWSGLPVDDPDKPCPNKHATWKTLPWKTVTVPGYVQTQHPEWANFTGYMWYWGQFTFNDAIPEGAEPTLVIGAVDDEDTVFFNGVKIGHTGKDTNPNNYWEAQRRYPIPANLFKKGSNANLVQTLFRDLNVGGGICKGPVQIIFEDPEKTAKRKLAERPYLHDVGRADDPYWHHGF